MGTGNVTLRPTTTYSSRLGGETSDITRLCLRNDPLAALLTRAGLLGDGARSLRWPVLFWGLYFVVADILLPLALHRFSTRPGYIGVFDPRVLPQRIVDAVFMPWLVYYYGRASITIPRLFDDLKRNDLWGPPDLEDTQQKVQSQSRAFRRWVGSIWLTPFALAASLWVTVFASIDYASPPRPLTFNNSDAHVLLFFMALFLLNFYMVAMLFMRFILLTAWLLRIQHQTHRKQLVVDVLHPDNQMGFAPISRAVILASKVIALGLISLVLILKGNRNLGLSPTSPDWLGYIGLLLLGGIFVVMPIFLIHRILASEKEHALRTLLEPAHYVRITTDLTEWLLISPTKQQRVLADQIMLMRLSQVRTWPVTANEVATVVFTYFLGTSLTILSSYQSIISFVTK